jgi:nucleoside-diphosphate-sugar epimerase
MPMRVEGRRVVITGATGFLGGALARALAQKGAEVHALARAAADRSALDGVAVTWHEGDVTVPSSLAGILGSADWIIHAAGRLGEAGVPEEVYRQVNVDGTRNVLATALSAGRKPRVLHLSSPGILGPTTREQVAEDAPWAPSNPYERSKAAAEKVALEFAAQGLPVIIARPGFIYGPGDHHVLKLFQAVGRGQFAYIGGGRRLCQPTFVADAVSGMLLCLSQGRPGEAYHITGPHPVTFRELGDAIASAFGVRPPWLSLPQSLAMAGAIGLEALGRLTGRKPPLSRTGVAFFSQDRCFSWQKAHDELGYSPQYDLTTGVSQTVQWYREHGWL